MTTALFIKANDRPADQSVSIRLYETFLNSYRESHPADSVIELDLYQEQLPYMGHTMISGNYKVSQGMTLTAEEKRVHEIAAAHLELFMAADKVVIAFPLWNLTVPAVLHSYLDYMHRPGITFKYTEKGPTGLLTDKKAALLNARGGVYADGNPLEMAVSFVRNQLHFFGVKNIETVVIEGHHQFSDRSESIIREGLQKAEAAAKTF